jgi:hypothetical protein
MEARVIGGDAFMNRAWPAIVETLIQSDKIRRVILYTNGIVIPLLKDLPVLAHEKVIVYMTDYGALSRNLNQIVALFKKHGVWHKINQIDVWLDCSSIHKHNRSAGQNDQLFSECTATSLVTLTDGKVFRCPYAASAFRLGAVAPCPTDYVDVDAWAKNQTDSAAGKKLLQAYIHSNQALSICDYCSSRLLKNSIPPAEQAQAPLPYKTQKDLSLLRHPA